METPTLTGSLKVAMLVSQLEQTAADAVLNSLSDVERERVRRLMPQAKAIPMSIVNQVAQEFLQFAEAGDASSGKNPVAGPFSPPGAGRPLDALAAARHMDAVQIVHSIKGEHPQVIALILTQLNHQKAGEVMELFPAALQGEVALRIAGLGKVHSWITEEIETFLQSVSVDQKEIAGAPAGGVGCLAQILKRLDGKTGESILENIEHSDFELAESINQMLFVFDDIVGVDDRGLQQLLRHVETQDLALALKAASDPVKEKIFGNMSARASSMLTEEIESMGPARMEDVSQAQLKITRIVQEMRKKGELFIRGQGEELIG